MSDTALELRLQVLEDIEAIRELKARYCLYCDDSYDSEGIASLFVDDAVWDGGVLGRCDGRDEIRSFFKSASRVISFAIHHVCNPLIEVEGDRATGQWYLFQPCTYTDGERAIWMLARYHDEYVREASAWKFQNVKIDVSCATPFHEGWAKTRLAPLQSANAQT